MADSLAIQNFTEIHNPFKARLEQTTLQSIPDSNTQTVVDFDTTATFDPGSLTTVGAAAKITVQANGYYGISGRCALVTATYTDGFVEILKNGSGTSISKGERANRGAGLVGFTVHDIVKLLAGDYVQLAVNQTSGGARNTVPGSNETYLSLSYLGPA